MCKAHRDLNAYSVTRARLLLRVSYFRGVYHRKRIRECQGWKAASHLEASTHTRASAHARSAQQSGASAPAHGFLVHSTPPLKGISRT